MYIPRLRAHIDLVMIDLIFCSGNRLLKHCILYICMLYVLNIIYGVYMLILISCQLLSFPDKSFLLRCRQQDCSTCNWNEYSAFAGCSWTQRTSSHLRVSPHEYYRDTSPRCLTIPVSLHHRILTDLRRNFVRNVERDMSTESAGSAVTHRRTDVAVQKIAPSLLRGLCKSPQRIVYRHLDFGADNHFIDSIFRSHFTTRVC